MRISRSFLQQMWVVQNSIQKLVKKKGMYFFAQVMSPEWYWMSERSQVTRIWKCYLLTDWLGLLQEMLPHRKTWHMMSVLGVLHLFLYLCICLSLCLCHYQCHCRQWWYLISLSHLLFKNIGNDGCFRNFVFVIVSN